MNVPPPLPAFAPVEAGRRIVALDVLRGFALLGIFLMNIEWFTRPWQESGSGLDPAATGVDRIAAWLVYVFVQGKFWVLFSLLFGMGFAVMSSRGGHGPAFRRVYLRRCLALLCVGLLHATLLWSGDILTLYALGGLVLLAFGGMPDRVRLWLGMALYVGVAGVYVLGGALLSVLPADAMSELAAMAVDARADAHAAALTYAGGNYLEVVARRAQDFWTTLAQGLVLLLPSVSGVFLLGAWLVRSGRMHDVAAQRGFFLRMAGWSIPLGLLLVVWSVSLGVQFDGVSQTGPMLLALGVMMLGSLPLALGYLSLVVLGLGVPGVSRVLAWLAPAGRMALSNYLMQSLLASTLFYGYGLGLWGQVGRAGQVALVLVIFGAQMLLSRAWLSRFRFGPVEWLLRWWSYGVRPPMRATAAG